MKWIDREGKVGGVLHWLDLLLLLIALTVVIRTIYLAKPKWRAGETRLIRLEVLAPGLPLIQADNIQVGQWVQDDRTGDFLGTIKEKATRSTKEYQLDEGEIFTYLHPEKKDLILFIERHGLLREQEGVFFGRRMIRAGEERIFRTMYSVFTGVVNRLSVVDE